MDFVIFGIGVLVGAGAMFVYRERVVSAAQYAEKEAYAILEDAKNEYAKMKAGVAHKLDSILK
jgi:hypothetical protein